MEIECLTPEFPQGARVYSSDGIAPTLLNSASAMRSQSILIRGGGGLDYKKKKKKKFFGRVFFNIKNPTKPVLAKKKNIFYR